MQCLDSPSLHLPQGASQQPQQSLLLSSVRFKHYFCCSKVALCIVILYTLTDLIDSPGFNTQRVHEFCSINMFSNITLNRQLNWFCNLLAAEEEAAEAPAEPEEAISKPPAKRRGRPPKHPKPPTAVAALEQPRTPAAAQEEHAQQEQEEAEAGRATRGRRKRAKTNETTGADGGGCPHLGVTSFRTFI